jgi:uncharacterized membrane protein YoaK (UPF0700 family)
MTLGLLLTATAGFVDAIGFIELGGYYLSFMSGNTTQLGTAMGSGHGDWLLLPASLISLFFIGGFLGALLASVPRWGQALATALALLSVVVVLLLVAGGTRPTQAMLVLAAGAGAQNAILPAHGAARLGTTFVTGTLFSAAQDLARSLHKAAPPWRWLQHLLVWLSLLVGALIGAGLHRTTGVLALGLPALVYAGFLAMFILRRK